MLPKKKPVTLNGKPFESDVITDSDFEHALARQEITLLAAGAERKVLGQLRVRIERGAVQQSERYYFDARLGLVRRLDPPAVAPTKRKQPQSEKRKRTEIEREAGT